MWISQCLQPRRPLRHHVDVSSGQLGLWPHVLRHVATTWHTLPTLRVAYICCVGGVPDMRAVCLFWRQGTDARWDAGDEVLASEQFWLDGRGVRVVQDPRMVQGRTEGLLICHMIFSAIVVHYDTLIYGCLCLQWQWFVVNKQAHCNTAFCQLKINSYELGYYLFLQVNWQVDQVNTSNRRWFGECNIIFK